jgi:tRNA(adenine34) deaminase
MARVSPDEALMRQALRAARAAARRGEVPVGAVVSKEGRILARAGNATLRRRDPTAHAEVVALRRAARALGNHRLTGCVLHVTLEPCLMCLGAMVQARISRCVFGARDPRVGAVDRFVRIASREGLNHRFPVTRGVLAQEAAELLRGFFRERRRKP